MKKTFAILMALVLALTLSCGAFAETYEIDTSFDGVVFAYEDINMQIKIPVDWYQLEMTEEQLAAGYFDCFSSEDGTYLMLSILDTPVETLIAEVETNDAIQDPEIITINDIEALTYVDVVNGCYGTFIPFMDGSMSVLAVMGPVESAAAELLLTLMATIDTIE